MKINGSLAKRRQRITRRAAFVFLIPAVLIMLIFIVYPIVDSFITSMYRWNGISADRTFIGLENWKTLVKDTSFWKAFANNVMIMFLSLLFQVPFAMALATFLDAGGKKTALFKTVWFLPYLMSSVAIGILFKYGLDANFGIIASISKAVGGGAIDLLGNPKYALISVIGVVCWQFIPFYMVYYLAAYGNIPTDLYEAACIDGATRWQYFWHISLPLLKPTIVSGATLSIVGSLKYFDLIFVMTGGGPGTATELMSTYMYKTAFDAFQMGYGSTIACGMFVLITAIALLLVGFVNRKGEE